MFEKLKSLVRRKQTDVKRVSPSALYSVPPRRYSDADDISNPLHPLNPLNVASPLNPISPFNGLSPISAWHSEPAHSSSSDVPCGSSSYSSDCSSGYSSDSGSSYDSGSSSSSCSSDSY